MYVHSTPISHFKAKFHHIIMIEISRDKWGTVCEADLTINFWKLASPGFYVIVICFSTDNCPPRSPEDQQRGQGEEWVIARNIGVLVLSELVQRFPVETSLKHSKHSAPKWLSRTPLFTKLTQSHLIIYVLLVDQSQAIADLLSHFW